MVASHLLSGYLLKDSLLGSHTVASLAGFLQIFSLLSLLLLASIAFLVWLQIAFQQSGICTHRSGFSVPLWVVIWLARFPSLEAENYTGPSQAHSQWDCGWVHLQPSSPRCRPALQEGTVLTEGDEMVLV